MTVQSDPSEMTPPSSRLLIWVLAAGLLVGELLVISLAYQHGFDFTCREAAPAWFCAFAGRIVPRALGVLAALALFMIARRTALSTLVAEPGPWQTGLALNLAGLALIMAPWMGLSDASSAMAVLLASLAWSFGGVMMAAGIAILLARPSAWWQLFQSHGLLLGLLIVLGLALPEIADQLQGLWRIEAVTEITFTAVAALLTWVGYEIMTDVSMKVIGDESFAVLVGPQCSGVEGFALITVFLAVYFGLFRRELRFPHVFILFPIGLALSWAFNILRITVLLMIGLEGQHELAVGGFHSHAGWLAFTTLSLLLILTSRFVPWFNRDTAAAQVISMPPFLSDPAVVRILPFIVFMASALLASTFSESPSLVYPWRALAMGAVLALLWPSIRALPWRFDLLAFGAGVAIAVMWIVTGPSEGEPPYGALAGGALGLWIVARILGTTLFVPIIEELFFRDYLMSRIAPAGKGVAMIVAVVISTVLFALLHDRWLVAGIAGVIFAALVWRSRNITDAILAHGVANGAIAVWAFATGAWHIL